MKNWVKIENTLQEWSLESALLQTSINTWGPKQVLTDLPTSALLLSCPGPARDTVYIWQIPEENQTPV